MGNYLQDAGRDAAICILLLAKSAKITERNAARRRRGRSRGELFAGSREGEGRDRGRKETHTRNVGGAEPLENSAPLFARRRRGCHRRNISEPEIYIMLHALEASHEYPSLDAVIAPLSHSNCRFCHGHASFHEQL